MLCKWGRHTLTRLVRRSRREGFFSETKSFRWLSQSCTSLLMLQYFLLFFDEDLLLWLQLLPPFFFSPGNEEDGIKKYMLPLLSSDSGERIKIFRTTLWEEGLLRTWFGFALRTSAAVIGPVISSTWPFKWTTRIKSRAPQGRTQAKQHLKLLPISMEMNSLLWRVEFGTLFCAYFSSSFFVKNVIKGGQGFIGTTVRTTHKKQSRMCIILFWIDNEESDLKWVIF